MIDEGEVALWNFGQEILLPRVAQGNLVFGTAIKCLLLNDNQIPLKVISEGPIENKSALVQVMAWLLTDDSWLPEWWSVISRLQ